ncbi:MAG: hypothetical protein ACK5R5_03755 [Alphaproteobacteria bacterium]
MSDEDKKDSGLVGTVAAGAAGLGAGYGIHNYMSNRAVKNALTDTEKLGEAAAKIADDGKITGGSGAIKKVLEADKLKDTLAGKQSSVGAGYNALSNFGAKIPDAITGEISKTESGFTFKIGNHEFSGLKSLPEGLPEAAGKIEGDAKHPLSAEDVKKFFAEGNKANVEKFLKGQQKEVLHELRAPLGAKFFSTKHWGGKAAVVAGTVGAAYLAKVVFDGVFGSRKDGHTARVEAERAQPAAAAGVSA